MGSIFNPPKAPAAPDVELPPPLPTEVSEDVLRARKGARRASATRRGREATILTRPTGLPSLVTR
jgi:hypothetical protein